jgi:hypothetical protein
VGSNQADSSGRREVLLPTLEHISTLDTCTAEHGMAWHMGGLCFADGGGHKQLAVRVAESALDAASAAGETTSTATVSPLSLPATPARLPSQEPTPQCLQVDGPAPAAFSALPSAAAAAAAAAAVWCQWLQQALGGCC